MKSRLLCLLLLPVTAYYLLIAFAPGALAGTLAGVPRSLLLATGLIWLGFLVTLLYVRAANRNGPRA